MKKVLVFKEKRVYCSPQIKHIKLDNQISLQLASSDEPMSEPNWSQKLRAPDYFKNSPYSV